MIDLTVSGRDSLMRHCDDTADFFRVLANPTRLMLMCYIAKGECSVAELERELGLRQPGLSQQLAELRQKGLVQTRRESRSIFYGISDPRVLPVLRAVQDAVSKPPELRPVALKPEAPLTSAIIPHVLGERARFARVSREPA